MGACVANLLAQGEEEAAEADAEGDDASQDEPLLDDAEGEGESAQRSAQAAQADSDGRLLVGDAAASSPAPAAPRLSDAELAAPALAANMEDLIASLQVVMLPSSRFVAADSALELGKSLGRIHHIGASSLKATCAAHRRCTCWVSCNGRFDECYDDLVRWLALNVAGLTIGEHQQRSVDIKISYGMRVRTKR